MDLNKLNAALGSGLSLRLDIKATGDAMEIVVIPVAGTKRNLVPAILTGTPDELQEGIDRALERILNANASLNETLAGIEKAAEEAATAAKAAAAKPKTPVKPKTAAHAPTRPVAEADDDNDGDDGDTPDGAPTAKGEKPAAKPAASIDADLFG
jgi:PRTRC genetic system protein E